MIRKTIRIVAAIFSIILIISGIYKVLVTGSNDWGLIIVGVLGSGKKGRSYVGKKGPQTVGKKRPLMVGLKRPLSFLFTAPI